MSYVVRHKNTGDFLGSQNQWTNHLDRALHFNSGWNLVQYLEKSRVREPQEALEVLIVSPTEQVLA
jgi:hypothetical protein